MRAHRLVLLGIAASALAIMPGCYTSLLDPSYDNNSSPPEGQNTNESSPDTSTILLPLQDPRGDQTGAIDVTGMLMVANTCTGDYVIYLLADSAHPFSGSYRININLYDQDLGTSKQYPAFFSNTMNDYTNSAPTRMKLLSGTDPRLKSWKAGDRVYTNSLANTGNPDDISLFRSSVWGLYGSGTGFLDNEDVIALKSWATPIRITKPVGVNFSVYLHLTEAQCRQILGI